MAPSSSVFFFFFFFYLTRWHYARTEVEAMERKEQQRKEKAKQLAAVSAGKEREKEGERRTERRERERKRKRKKERKKEIFEESERWKKKRTHRPYFSFFFSFFLPYLSLSFFYMKNRANFPLFFFLSPCSSPLFRRALCSFLLNPFPSAESRLGSCSRSPATHAYGTAARFSGAPCSRP